MYVLVGNDNAIEAVRGLVTGDPDALTYVPVVGEHVTSLVFPDGIGIQEAYVTAVAALMHHIAPVVPDKNVAYTPAWIESDSPGLLTLLLDHYGMNPKKNSRPPTWGKKG